MKTIIAAVVIALLAVSHSAEAAKGVDLSTLASVYVI